VSDVVPGLPDAAPYAEPMVLALGAFDGVHAGHRRLLRRLASEARHRNARAVALTFDPHPRCVLDPAGCPAMLSDVEERIALLREAGAGEVHVVRFSTELSRWRAERFITALGSLGRLRALLGGPGFALGHRREGTAELLRRLGDRHGYIYVEVAPVLRAGRPVSSTRIRQAVQAGRVEEAARMLRRPHRVTGTVVRGHNRGAQLGYPTANLDVSPGRCLPGTGIYATRVLLDGRRVPAATSVGTNPTFDDSGMVSVEPHLLDFDQDLLGRRLTVEFVRRLRSERRFASVEALGRQIARDVERTRRLLE
jgi:riboflavin kinase / FMN adenylyltransferase